MSKPVPTIATATADDIDEILDMTEVFYGELDIAFDRATSNRALKELIGDASVGRVFLMKQNETVAGYCVLVFVFSIEFGGKVAVVDEYFVKPAERCTGLGRTGLNTIVEQCQTLGLRGMRLETLSDRATSFYQRCGFSDLERKVLFMQLPQPIPVEA